MQVQQKTPLTSSFSVKFEEDTLIIDPTNEHQFTLIWLTGLNYHPSRFLEFFLSAPICETLFNRGFRVVVPCPPYRKTTVDNNQVFLSWFDVKDRSENTFKMPMDQFLNQAFNIGDIEESYNQINTVIEKELSTLNGKENHLYLGGFSQGCAMTLYVGFKKGIKWGGLIPVAGYMFEHSPYNNNELNIPLRIFHGNIDPIRPFEFIKASYERFGLGESVIMIDNMIHEYMRMELRQKISDFLAQ